MCMGMGESGVRRAVVCIHCVRCVHIILSSELIYKNNKQI